MSGQVLDALKELEKLKELDESTYKVMVIWLDLVMGKDEEAANRCEELPAQNLYDYEKLAFLCLLYRKLGQKDKLISTFGKPESLHLNRFTAKFWLAIGCSAVGRIEKALKLFEESFQERSLYFRDLRLYIVPEELRMHPRFIDLFKMDKRIANR